MTDYTMRQPVLVDGIPGIIAGRTYGTQQFDVLLASGAIKANVDVDRLRPRGPLEEVK